MTLSRSLYRSFGVLLVLLLCLTGFSLFNFRRLSDADDWKVHTFKVLQAIHRVQRDFESMDSGVRGYIIENNGDSIALYQKGRSDSLTDIAKLEKLTSDRPEHTQTLEDLKTKRQFWIDTYLETIIEIRNSTPDDLQALQKSAALATGRRRTLLQLLALTTHMEDLEEGLLVERSADQKHWQELTELTLWVGGAFSILLAVSLTVLVSGASKKLDIAHARLTHSNAQLAETNEQFAVTNARLSSEIEQRRAAENKLRQTVDELERSNSELEQFAYVASHDLQEPLRAVAGCVQVLKKRYSGQLDARADQFIEHAVDGAQRMQNLINDLLSYSRVGTKGKAFETVSMEKVMSRATINISESIADTQAQITHDALPEVLGDSTQLEQLMQNLLSNAIKFRGEAPPHVHVIYREEENAKVFGVRDNGLGIEPQYFERIFVMFQRLHTRSEYPGTGIGLAICKKIVERHHGKIWVESTQGKGTTFWFSIATQPGDGFTTGGNSEQNAETLPLAAPSVTA